MDSSPFYTARLCLEPLVRQHAAAFYPLLQDERIYQFIPQTPPGSLEELERRYELLERRASPDGEEKWLNWALRLRSNQHYIGQLQATVLGDGTGLISYQLLSVYWGQGYAHEACTWLLRELATMNVDVVRAEVDTRNLASIRLLDRLGFKRVRFTANADWFKGASSHEYTYRWLKPESADLEVPGS